jgi:hypothetical protein
MDKNEDEVWKVELRRVEQVLKIRLEYLEKEVKRLREKLERLERTRGVSGAI